jgi:kinesin family protein 5
MNERQDRPVTKKLTQSLAAPSNAAKTVKSNNDKSSNSDAPQQSNTSSAALGSSQMSTSTGNVKVVCRVRPFNTKELAMGTAACVEFPDQQTINIKTSQHSEIGPGTHKFQFDRVFPLVSNQEDVYNFAAKPVVESILEGFNGTIFAYGQTSSGKTHTMQGPSIDDQQLKGIIPRMVNTVFEAISATPDHIEFTVRVSIVEIYMEKIRDLICPEKINLKVREDKGRGVYIEDVTESYVSEEKDVYDLMRLGNSNRAISATNMNEGSSRSHLIFMMSIHQNNLHEMSAKTGKLFLVDLAGSEKIAKTGAEGKTLEEAKKINQSLSALGNVINALTDGKTHHIPYRNSKLTRVLQESLGGNSRTTLIITCSPSIFNEQETLGTLRFGFRAKSIKNTPKINREFTVAELQLLLEKAEKTIEDKEKRIKQIEQMLVQNGHQLPKIDEVITKIPEENKSITEKSTEDGISSDEEDSKSFAKKELPSITHIINNDDLTRIKLLEAELEQEKNSVRIQTEKLNILRQEYAYLNAKSITTEKENEALIHKLATLTLKMQEFEETMREKEEKLEELPTLQDLRDTLMVEVDELKKNKDYMLKQLDEKNEEIERLRGQLGQGPVKLGSRPEISSQKPMVIDNNKQELLVAFNSKLDSVENSTTRKILQDLVLKMMMNPSSDTPVKASVVSDKPEKSQEELKNEIKFVRNEYHSEQEKHTKLKSEYEKLSKEYDKILKCNVPNFDEIKQKIVEDTLGRERQKYDKEKGLILKDLQNRVDKVVKLEIELDEEKEKNRNLESTMTEGEKKLKKKVNALEINLETLTNMYQTLNSQKHKWNLDHQLNEKKLARKTDRIMNLEKQLHETKDLVGQYKGKIESLKALISVSNSNNIPMHEIWNENYENVEPMANIGGDMKHLEGTPADRGHSNHDDLRKSLPSATSARIVKFIRGGQSKAGSISKLPPGKINFSSFSIPNSELKQITKTDNNKVEPH